MKKRQQNYHLSAANGIVPLIPHGKLNTPTVLYTPEAKIAIDYIVKKTSSEVGWFGLVEDLEDDTYLITDIFIPRQIVSGTTVDMDPEAITSLTMELLDAGKDPSQLRYHGHSHVNMQVSPSSTDQDMVDDFLEHADWFIRGIYNKEGKSRVDFFDTRVGFAFNNIQDDVLEPDLPDDFYDKLDTALKQNLETYRAKVIPVGRNHNSIQPARLPNGRTLNHASEFFDYYDWEESLIHDSWGMTAREREEIEEYKAKLADPFYASEN